MSTQITAKNGSGASPPTAPIALRVVDEPLHVEAERSYLAVGVLLQAGLVHGSAIKFPVTQ